MLDAEEFLSRIVPDEGFLVFAFKGTGAGMAHRFFRRQDLSDALGWLRYMGHRTDVWYAPAAYRDADLKGYDKLGRATYRGRRTQENVISVKCFWYDADISRPGDGKQPSQVWKDQIELTSWLRQLKQLIPLPNLWIRSGYGVHLYWVLDNAIPRDRWIIYAQGFKSLLQQAGARGDIGISTDCARILRPPESWNHKVPASPMQCFDDTPAKLGLPVYYDTNFLTTLNNQPLSTGTNLTSHSSRVAPTPLISAAKAGLSHAPRDIQKIASRCAQVEKSLVENGEHDGRQLWFLLLNLAFICGDQQAAHDLGSKHPGYTTGDTDQEWDQRVHEHQTKDFGAPYCNSFDTARPGICPGCPHWQRIDTPYALGVDEISTTGLPATYQRNNGTIEMQTKDGGWQKLVDGDVSNARVQLTPEGWRILFDYSYGPRVHPIVANSIDISAAVDKTRSLFGRQHIPLRRFNALPFGDMIMAWIDELRKYYTGDSAPPQFGWVYKDNKELGLSVGGTFYNRNSETSTDTLPGDPKIHASYQPVGEFARWKEAVEFIVEGKVEHQVIVATSFAAPLMELIGESGGVMSVWSMETGARKTALLKCGASVWSNPQSMSSRRDTANSVQEHLGQIKIMPVYWDEIHLALKEDNAAMVDMFFAITQGRGRGRLNQRMEQREVGQWCTLMVTASNSPMLEMVELDRPGTNAGQARVFEIELKLPKDKPAMQAITQGQRMVHLLDQNYGTAGRIYAQYLACNVDNIKKLLQHQHSRLLQETGGGSDERFHQNMITGIVTGAFIARHLNLFPFDINRMYRFLKDRLVNMRTDREQAPQDNLAWLVRVFEKFLTDHTGDYLVAQSFVPRGRKGGMGHDPIIRHQPSAKCDRILIYTGIDDATMRFDCVAFKKWCEKEKLSPKVVEDRMQQEWPIVKKRNKLGGGTAWVSGGNPWIWELQLSTPELVHHVTDWGAPSTGTNVVAI